MSEKEKFEKEFEQEMIDLLVLTFPSIGCFDVDGRKKGRELGI